jgi:hypothetical protein
MLKKFLIAVSVVFGIAILVVLVMFVGGILVASCQEKEPVDPPANTPGYKLFAGTSRGFKISFEYPDTWSRGPLRRSNTYNYLALLPPDSRLVISSDVGKSLGGDYNATDLIQYWLDSESKYSEFKIISREKVLLGRVEGEEAIFSYRFYSEDPHGPPVYAELGERVIGRALAVDAGGYLYYVDFLAAADKYDNAKLGLEHVIATFKFIY